MQTCFSELQKENFLLWSENILQVNFSLLNTEQRKRLQGAAKMPTAQFKDYKMNFFALCALCIKERGTVCYWKKQN